MPGGGERYGDRDWTGPARDRRDEGLRPPDCAVSSQPSLSFLVMPTRWRPVSPLRPRPGRCWALRWPCCRWATGTCRSLIVWEQLTYQEVLVALAIPVGTVRSWLHRARTMFVEHSPEQTRRQRMRKSRPMNDVDLPWELAQEMKPPDPAELGTARRRAGRRDHRRPGSRTLDTGGLPARFSDIILLVLSAQAYGVDPAVVAAAAAAVVAALLVTVGGNTVKHAVPRRRRSRSPGAPHRAARAALQMQAGARCQVLSSSTRRRKREWQPVRVLGRRRTAPGPG